MNRAADTKPALHVEELEPGRYRVTGGAEPHVVELTSRAECDCADYRYRRCVCKHLTAVEHYLRQDTT